PAPGEAVAAGRARPRPITDQERRRIHDLSREEIHDEKRGISRRRTQEEIGKIVGRDKARVSGVLGKSRPATPAPGEAVAAGRARRRPLTDQERRRIHDLSREEIPDEKWGISRRRTHEEIAEIVDRDKARVSRELRKSRPATPAPGEAVAAGPARRRPLTDQERRRIHDLSREEIPDEKRGISRRRTQEEIAKIVGRDKGTVNWELGKSRPATPAPGEAVAAGPARPRPITDQERRRIHDLSREEIPDEKRGISRRRTHREIGKIVGRERATVSVVLGKTRPATPAPGEAVAAGRARPRPITDQERRRIHDLSREEIPDERGISRRRTHEEIAEIVDRGQSTVSRELRKSRPATPAPGEAVAAGPARRRPLTDQERQEIARRHGQGEHLTAIATAL
ncbi:MAG: hypothetical protein ACRC67_42740, partial [Inquilinus sp.]|uniref:hypothetical protein n=1 Tax=Inquilinus sp. TaxID=1932117 RepID=UPI003F3B486A